MKNLLTFFLATCFFSCFAQGDTLILLNGPDLYTDICSFTLTDRGGPNGDYQDFKKDVITIKPDSASGFVIEFEEFITQACCDFLIIEAFEEGNSVFFDTYSGSVNFEVMQIEADSLLIGFFTSLTGTDEGFIIHVNCKKEVPPEADFSAYSTVICDNILQLYDDSFLAPTSWTWKVQGEVVATTENATVILDAPGLYDVELVACNDYGCDSLLREKYITFSDDPENCPVATLIFADTISIVGCNGEFSSPVEEPFFDKKTAYSTVYAPNASAIDISFVDFELKQGDALEVYGENGLGYELLDKLTVNTVQVDFSYAYNSLLFVWRDKSSGNESAFTAVYSCVLAGDPAADFSKDSLPSSCRNIQFYDQSSEEPYEWQWFVNDELVSEVQHPILSFYGADTFDISLIACNFQTCDTVAKEQFVTLGNSDMDCDQIFMVNGTDQITDACFGTLIDDGGIYGDYISPSSSTVLVSPESTHAFNLAVSYIEVESSQDTLSLFKEKNGLWVIEKQWTSDATDLELLVVGNKLRFEWSSTSLQGDRGFEIEWSCIPLTEVVASFEIDSSLICGSILHFEDRSAGFPDSYGWWVDGDQVGNNFDLRLEDIDLGLLLVDFVVCNPLGCDTTSQQFFYDPELTDCDMISMVDDDDFIVKRCSGQITDGGGINSNYGNDLRQKLVLDNSDAFGYLIDLELLSLASGDTLKIFMGDDLDSLFLRDNFTSVDGVTSYLTVGRYLVIEFSSNAETTDLGFILSYTCQMQALPPQFVLDYSNDTCSSVYDFELISTNADSIVWSINDISIGNGESLRYEFIELGEHIVEVNAWNDFGMTMDSIKFYNETPGIYYEIEDSVLLNTSLDIFLLSPDPQLIESVEWYLDGEFVIDEFAIDFVLDELRVYDLTCVVTLNNGCILTKNNLIKAVLFIGIDELLGKLDSWKVYPVPANEEIYVESEKRREVVRVEVRNTFGKVYLSREVDWPTDKNKIVVSDLSDGMYILTLVYKDGLMSSKKLLIVNQ